MAGLTFVLPGPIESRTGGFIYDRRIIEGLRALGHDVAVIELEGRFPFPDDKEKNAASRRLERIPQGALVVVDGLALGCLPEVVERIAAHRRLIGLVHHPLALESGLSFEEAAGLEQSERTALAKCHQVIVSSSMTARTLSDGAWTPAPLTVVEPGTDPAPVAIGGDSDILELLCVATLIPRKDHLTLLEALSGLSDLDWRLRCVGAPRDLETAQAIEKKIDAFGLTDCVELLGELEGGDLDTLYHGSDLFVLASVYEGFGMVITEAVMRGLPVITTRGGALPETLPPGCGLLSAPRDVKSLRENLRTVLSKPEELLKLRRAALSARETLRGWPEAAAAFAKALALK